MERRPRNAELTKAAILQAARHLFAERDISAVSIRDIAAAAGVSHGLVQQYFGTRDEMVAAIIKGEVEAFTSARPQLAGWAAGDLEVAREVLTASLPRFREFALLMVRAELAGVRPERMIDAATPTPATQLGELIAAWQADSTKPSVMDPKLVSAFIVASVFGFEAMSAWVMTAVGLSPEDFAARQDEIIDIAVRLIGLAGGVASDGPSEGNA
ncbi:MAG TPA: helix-turn-helix domain-containing protein [Propionicimonas sp.]|nr:helix-turn-helix domain-containing protein [Propionicimonas sp.]HRA05423.1 helix-turn-helix domain-containing protein [Propionicimonas sp.]